MPDAWENLDEAFAKLEFEVTDTVRGLTVELWNKVLKRTPQFYGRMVASWTYTLNPAEVYDRSDYVRVQEHDANTDYMDRFGSFAGFMKGHPEAIAIANAESAQKDRAFKLGDTVWFTNGVDHGEGPYAAKVEFGEIHLRAVNIPGNAVARTIDWAKTNFGDDMSPRVAARLRELTIGFPFQVPDGV